MSKRRPRFTRRQRRILVMLGTAVVVVFGLLGYSVLTTLGRLDLSGRREAYVSPTRAALSPLATATSSSPLATSAATYTLSVTVTVQSTPPTPVSTPTPSPSPTPTRTPTPTTVPSPTPTPTRPPPLSPVDSARFVQEVGQIVAELRDLPPIGQIPVTFPTLHEVSVALLQRYQEEQPQEELALYALLRMIPELEPVPLPDVGSQATSISSYYVAQEEQISIVTGRGPTTPEDELGLVHALVNALQDNRYDLETLTPCRDTTDASLALRALVEGDAVLVTALYAGIESGNDETERVARLVVAAEAPGYSQLEDSEAMARLRLFPYLDGARLVEELYAVGGWSGVERAYARVPCSTEQVLHPDIYLEREAAQDVAVPDLGATLGESWVASRRDTLGELIIGLHLASNLDDDGYAWDAASGWAGDSLAVWEHTKETGRLVAWRTAWDSLEDARSFESAYARMAPRLAIPPLIAADPPAGMPGRYWEGAVGAAYLERAGRVVTIVWGTGAGADVTTLAAQVMP